MTGSQIEGGRETGRRRDRKIDSIGRVNDREIGRQNDSEGGRTYREKQIGRQRGKQIREGDGEEEVTVVW